MSLRTAADVLEEYNATRAAYLRAVDGLSADMSDDEASVSVTRQRIDALAALMQALSNEHDRLSRGGIRLYAAIPTDV